MSRYIKDGRIIRSGEAVTIGEYIVVNAPEELLLENGWSVYVEPTPEPHIETEEEDEERYKYRVSEIIRETYTIDDELALLRQRDSKPSEFAAYNAVCENAKTKAREVVCHLIPCYRKSDNVVGMYDIVRDSFFYPNQTKPFIAGPEI